VGQCSRAGTDLERVASIQSKSTIRKECPPTRACAELIRAVVATNRESNTTTKNRRILLKNKSFQDSLGFSIALSVPACMEQIPAGTFALFDPVSMSTFL
jgi:hypothetical protein